MPSDYFALQKLNNQLFPKSLRENFIEITVSYTLIRENVLCIHEIYDMQKIQSICNFYHEISSNEKNFYLHYMITVSVSQLICKTL